VELCHAAGVPLAYVMASGAGPLLPFFRETGLDVYSNIDPDAPGTDLQTLKTAAGGHFTLCGGLNNYHVLEQGTEDEVRRAVRLAIDTLAPGGGFILAPADTLNVVSATCERNFETLVATWKEMA
jgi:uroporphyrinogen decarboxylase